MFVIPSEHGDYLSVASGFMVSLQRARNTKNASLMNMSFVLSCRWAFA
jgi:hypothetical protein